MPSCIECKHFSSWRKGLAWLYVQEQWFCEHEDREGGRWNVLQQVTRSTKCKRFKAADPETVAKRIEFLEKLKGANE